MNPSGSARSRLVRSTWAARSWGAFRRTGGFRTVQLNIAGWLAVLAPGALVGLITGLIISQHVLAITVVCVAAAWSVALIADYLKWRRSETGFDISDLSDEARLKLTTRLQAEGISFRIEQLWFEDDLPRQSLRLTMRQRRQVEEIILNVS